MPVLLVAYDLNAPGQKHTNLLKKIKTFPWAMLSESSYAIKTNLSVTKIYDQLNQYIDKNDNLYIIPMKKPWHGYGSKDVVEWLNNNLTG